MRSPKKNLEKFFSIHGNQLKLLRVKHARTFGQRFMGLMGVSPREHDYALVFHMNEEGKMSASIHMLFMKMPIDVLFLDSEKKVVDIVSCLRPWVWNYTPKHESKFVVELPAHVLSEKIISGMRVTW
jgi:hypothetical protein